MADEYADRLKAEELRMLQEDEAFARCLLKVFKKKSHVTKTSLFVSLAQKMLNSDDAATKRLLGGLLPMESWYYDNKSVYQAKSQ